MPKALTIEEKRDRAIAKANDVLAVVKPEDTSSTVKPMIRKAPDRASRPTRGVFNGTKGKLKIGDADTRNFAESGWSLHIFNDSPGRIEEALSDGWEFVTRDEIGSVVANVVDGNTDLGNKIRFRVGQTEAGGGLFAYLMKIPTFSYIENQGQLQKRNDMVDDVIRSGKMNAVEGAYGKEGIKMQYNQSK
jgi:hypothetical protein